MLIALAAMLAVAASAVPPPPDQVRAECAHSTYATDMLVCSDTTLKARDEDMAALLASAGSVAPAGQPPMLEAQGAWFRRRSLCAFKADQRGCAIGAYDERIAVLKALGTVELAESQFSCRASWRTGPIAATLTDDGVLVARVGAQLVAVGIAAPPGSVWRPYAPLERRTSHDLRITTADHASLRCTQVKP